MHRIFVALLAVMLAAPASAEDAVSLRLTHQSVIKTTFLLYHAAVSAIAGG